jgi:putative nucleotidyltransferase with HDIG domain
MSERLVKKLLDTNKELLLIFSILAFAAVVNFFVSSQRLLLSFYNLPTLFAAYYFGRKRAVQTAVASILVVAWVTLGNPYVFAAGKIQLPHRGLDIYLDLVTWGSFLVVTAYATGTLYERKEQHLHELRHTYEGILLILSHFIANDKYTQNHAYRVSVYAAKVAGYMGLKEDQVEDVRAAALLHDLGKLNISRDILYKAARLSETEYEQIRSHVDEGVRLLKPVGGSLKRVIPIVLAHHDKFDGSGYNSLQGEGIPIEARILSVADVYDSLTTDRPYRKAMSPFEAREMIVQGAGKDFDPKVVAAFERAFRNNEFEIPEYLV